MNLKQKHDDFMRRWKADGSPVARVTCPHCEKSHEVQQIPGTDTLTTCPNCEELFWKEIDSNGKAHAALPEHVCQAIQLNRHLAEGGLV